MLKSYIATYVSVLKKAQENGGALIVLDEVATCLSLFVHMADATPPDVDTGETAATPTDWVSMTRCEYDDTLRHEFDCGNAEGRASFRDKILLAISARSASDLFRRDTFAAQSADWFYHQGVIRGINELSAIIAGMK